MAFYLKRFPGLLAFIVLWVSPVMAGGNGESKSSPRPAPPPARSSAPAPGAAASQNSLFTGDGGRGKSIAILAPQAAGLAKGQDYLPSLVQGELVSVFSGYSAIAVLDRASLEEQYAELESGYYDDHAAEGADLGHLSPTDYILGGTITRTATGYALQMRITRTADKMTAASYSGTCTFTELDNLTAIRRASLDLLEKLGVAVTDRARSELSGAAAANHVQAQTAQAQGLTALAQGSTVEAMTYYYQAVSFEPALQAADGRLSQLTVQVSGGLGASVKNDIQARRDWLNLMKECAAFMRDHPPYELLYDPGVEQDGATDYAKETANFTMSIALAPSAAGFQVLNDLLAGLEKSGRRSVWGFEGWPFLPLNPAAPEALLWGGQRSFTAAGEAALVNADGKTLGRTRFTLTIGDIGFSAGAKSLAAPPPAAQVLRFAGVNANDLTDPLTVRILNVNGKTAEAAGEAGYMRIAADTAGIARRELRRVAEEQQRERDRQEAVKYNTSGLEYHNKKDYDRAIADYTQAIRLDPNDAAAYINRGSAYNDKGDYDRAITDLNQAIRLDPNDATAYNNRGFAYHNKKDYDRARADFTQAIRLNPNNDIYYNNRGNAYYSQRDYNSAIADYTTAIRLNPDSGILYSNRGDAYKNIKNLDSAIWDYEAALRLRPEDDSIRDKLVQAYCDRGYIFIIDWTGPPVSNADYNRFVTNYEAALRIKPNSKARNTFEFYKVEFQKQMRGEFKNVRDRPVGLPPTDNWWR